MGTVSSVGIATRYGLESPEIESWYRCDFPHRLRTALRPTDDLLLREVKRLTDTASDSHLEDASKPETLFEIWSLLRSEYIDFAKHSVQELVPFVSKYRCEAEFSKTNSKQRS